jgi:hypothetical protein
MAGQGTDRDRRSERFLPGGALAVRAATRSCPRQPDDRRVRTCRPDPGLAPRRPFQLRFQHARQEPVRDVEMPYGDADAVAGPLRAGHARARLPSRARMDQGRTRHPQGISAQIDSYSAFFENDHATPTGLGGYLKERGIRSDIGRAGDRFLRRLFGARRARLGFGHCGDGRLPRHRSGRFAGAP